MCAVPSSEHTSNDEGDEQRRDRGPGREPGGEASVPSPPPTVCISYHEKETVFTKIN